jgi:hypothetical protein
MKYLTGLPHLQGLQLAVARLRHVFVLRLVRLPVPHQRPDCVEQDLIGY